LNERHNDNATSKESMRGIQIRYLIVAYVTITYVYVVDIAIVYKI